MIRLRSVTVTRGPTLIAADLDLEITSGSVFWVVGPNGAGKSSLLRVLAGLDRPRTGSVLHTGPRLLYFHSEMALPPSVTVRDWDRLAGRVGRGAGAGDRTPLRPDVGPRRRIGRLSTGQRKRLLLDVLLRQPGPLLLDEPFEHLSPGAKSSLRALIEERAREAVVVVATNQHTARVARDGGIHLEAGTVSFLGATGGPA